MNRFVLYIAFMLCACNLKAQGQNLVYNGGFEEYYSCPVSNDLGNDQLELAKGWWKPTLGTSDYFNRCNHFEVGVPSNLFGFQEANDGDAYAGLVLEWDINGNYITFEYIACELSLSLKACYEYQFSMFVSLAEVSSYGVTKLGASFSSEYEYNPNHNPLAIQNEIVNLQLPLVDTAEWIEITGSFVAQGSEKYLTIGYFFPSVLSDTTFIQNVVGNTRAVYYYIDNVSLYEIGPVGEDNCTIGEITFPNVITVNGDQINDILDIGYLTYLNPEVKILNRWGDVVTRLNKDNLIWDGGNCTAGIYYYLINFPSETGLKQQNGFIHLVR